MSLLSSITGIDIKISHGRLVRFRIGRKATDALCEYLDRQLENKGVDEPVREAILVALRNLCTS